LISILPIHGLLIHGLPIVGKEEAMEQLKAKSLYISHVVSNVYGTEIEIGLLLGRLTVLEKKLGPIMSNF
jgi:hypothetical protein